MPELDILNSGTDDYFMAIYRMLSKDQEKRPTATELLKIPLISKHISVSNFT